MGDFTARLDRGGEGRLDVVHQPVRAHDRRFGFVHGRPRGAHSCRSPCTDTAASQ